MLSFIKLSNLSELVRIVRVVIHLIKVHYIYIPSIPLHLSTHKKVTSAYIIFQTLSNLPMDAVATHLLLLTSAIPHFTPPSTLNPPPLQPTPQRHWKHFRQWTVYNILPCSVSRRLHITRRVSLLPNQHRRSLRIIRSSPIRVRH